MNLRLRADIVQYVCHWTLSHNKPCLWLRERCEIEKKAATHSIRLIREQLQESDTAAGREPGTDGLGIRITPMSHSASRPHRHIALCLANSSRGLQWFVCPSPRKLTFSRLPLTATYAEGCDTSVGTPIGWMRRSVHTMRRSVHIRKSTSHRQSLHAYRPHPQQLWTRRPRRAVRRIAS